MKWTAWLDSYSTRLAKEVTEGVSLDDLNQERTKVMNDNNPKFVLRNYIAQNAISAAEKGDYTEVRDLSIINSCKPLKSITFHRIFQCVACTGPRSAADVIFCCGATLWMNLHCMRC